MVTSPTGVAALETQKPSFSAVNFARYYDGETDGRARRSRRACRNAPKKLAETSPPAGHLRNASRRSESCEQSAGCCGASRWSCWHVNVTAARLSQWWDRAVLAAEAALKEHERDDRDDEVARLKGKVGEMTMETELLREKIARLETGAPLARRRSRP